MTSLDEHSDVLIVGAGPAGAAAALSCVRQSVGRVLMLDRAVFPRPRTCAAVISPRARRHLVQMGVWDAIEPASYAVYSVRIMSPSGRSLTLSGATAHVLLREALDDMLVQAAVAEGAVFRDSTAVLDLLEEDGVVVGARTDRGVIRAPWVILASGSSLELLPSRRTGDTLHTCIRRYEGAAVTPHLVDVVFDAELAPGFVWLIPEQEEIISVGIVSAPESRRAPSEAIHEKLAQRHFAARLAPGRPLGDAVTHPIACSARIGRIAKPGLLSVGEAARLANRGSGEGIAFALESGALAARSINLGMRKGASAAWVVRHYRRACGRDIAPALRAGALFSRIGAPAIEGLVRAGGSALVKQLAGNVVATLGR